MVIRHATLADVPLMLPLLEQLGYPTTVDELAERVRLYADQENYAILVVELDGKVAGLEALAFSELFVREGKRCRVEALVIDAACRRKGIGRALTEYAERLAEQKGCIGVELTSGVRRAHDGTHDFYRALGYGNEGENAMVYFAKRF